MPSISSFEHLDYITNYYKFTTTQPSSLVYDHRNVQEHSSNTSQTAAAENVYVTHHYEDVELDCRQHGPDAGHCEPEEEQPRYNVFVSLSQNDVDVGDYLTIM